MNGVRVYSITVSQTANFISVIKRIQSAEIAAFDGTVSEALEAAKGGAFGGTLAGIPFA